MKNINLNKTVAALIICAMVASCAPSPQHPNSASTENRNSSNKLIPENLKWSERMALSEIHRFPDPTLLDFRTEPKWSYTNGLVLQSMYQVYKQTKNEQIFAYIYDYGNRMINQEGKINTYNFDDLNLDMVKSGDALFDLYEKTGEERFKIAMDELDLQLEKQPTTSEGGYWHKKVYPHQMWLDGVYMAEPFHAKYADKFLKGEKANEAFDKIVLQFDLIEKYTRDPKTGLYFHGWDESREQFWADKETGLSKNFWSRGMGWYGMAIVDVLDYLPKNHEGRERLIKYLNQYAEAIVKVQHESGTWYQVLDQGNREGNYLEATGSAMFTYTLAKGVNKGYLPKKYKKIAKKAYQGMLNEFVNVEENGVVNLEKCCSVAGLGGGKDQRRDGTFEYYISEPVRANDPKGTGTFILASIELNK